MAFFIFSYRLGTLSATHRVYLEITVVFTYATVFNIPFFSELPCPEVIFFLRKSRDPERRCYMTVIIIKDPDMIRPN
jgi:hypothetical protein